MALSDTKVMCVNVRSSSGLRGMFRSVQTIACGTRSVGGVTGNMIRTGLLALALTAPAAAQDWSRVGQMAGDLRSDDPALAYKAAIAACIATRGNPEWAKLIFESAGWTFVKDAEPIMQGFQSPHPDIYVRYTSGGDFCAAFSESHGTEKATANVLHIIVAGMLSVDTAPSDLRCSAYALAEGIVAEITSSGTDPGCDASGNSSVRIHFTPRS